MIFSYSNIFLSGSKLFGGDFTQIIVNRLIKKRHYNIKHSLRVEIFIGKRQINAQTCLF